MTIKLEIENPIDVRDLADLIYDHHGIRMVASSLTDELYGHITQIITESCVCLEVVFYEEDSPAETTDVTKGRTTTLRACTNPLTEQEILDLIPNIS